MEHTTGKRIETVTVVVVNSRGEARRYTFETIISAEDFVRLWLQSYPSAVARMVWGETDERTGRRRRAEKQFGERG